MIQVGEIERAIKTTTELLKDNPSDATLLFYQTEALFERSERNYKRRKFKSAFMDVEKVYKVWQNNILVRQRYDELKNKSNLIDEPDSLEKKFFNTVVPISMMGGVEDKLKEGSALNKSEQGFSEEGKILVQHLERLEILFIFAILIFGIMNAILVYSITRKK